MTNKKLKVGNVPNLRFSGFEGELNSYKKYLFKDIFLFSTGKNIKQSEASPKFETPCVRYGELYHLYNEVITEVFNKTNLNKSELLFSDGDEILLPSAGEDPLDIGSASALTVKNVAIGRTINILKPSKPNIYSQVYVSYYINQRLKKVISTLAKGVSISNVYNSDLQTLEIILPGLYEQQKIASFLSLIDERIQTQNKIIEGLKVQMLGLQEKIFRQKIKIRDEHGNEFPEWEFKNGGELFYGAANKNHNSDLPILAITQDHGAVPRDLIDYQISVTDKSVESYKVVEIGDFIISLRSFQGGIEYSNYKGICSPAYIILKNKCEVEKHFYKYYFKTKYYIKLLNKKLEGIRDGKMISYAYFSEIPLPYPSIEEQVVISTILCSFERKIELEKRILKGYEDQKNYLLQNLLCK